MLHYNKEFRFIISDTGFIKNTVTGDIGTSFSLGKNELNDHFKEITEEEYNIELEKQIETSASEIPPEEISKE